MQINDMKMRYQKVYNQVLLIKTCLCEQKMVGNPAWRCQQLNFQRFPQNSYFVLIIGDKVWKWWKSDK